MDRGIGTNRLNKLQRWCPTGSTDFVSSMGPCPSVDSSNSMSKSEETRNCTLAWTSERKVFGRVIDRVSDNFVLSRTVFGAGLVTLILQPVLLVCSGPIY